MNINDLIIHLCELKERYGNVPVVIPAIDNIFCQINLEPEHLHLIDALVLSQDKTRLVAKEALVIKHTNSVINYVTGITMLKCERKEE